MSAIVVRPIMDDEIGHAASLVADVLSAGDKIEYRAIYDRYAKDFPTRPRTTQHCYRGVVHKNQILSLAHIIDFSLRYGRADLHVIGIGMVCTHPTYRNRGYARAIIKDTLTYAAEQGAHLVVVNSNLPDYFQQFGFSPVWAKYTLQAPTAIASKLKQPLQLRVATPADLPIMQQLYDRHWGLRVTAERSTALWRWRMNLGRGEAIVMLNKSHQIEGYIWHLADDFSSKNEIVANSPSAITTALAYSGRRWLAGGYNNLSWSVPPDDVIIPYAQQMLPISMSASYDPSGGWLARVIDSNALLRELLPEIIAQAQANNSQFKPSDLILNITPDGVEIGMNHQPDTQCHLSMRDFMQIVFGSLRPEALAVRQQLSQIHIRLLESLFPPRIAALAAWDWF